VLRRAKVVQKFKKRPVNITKENIYHNVVFLFAYIEATFYKFLITIYVNCKITHWNKSYES
jgi:hypothetical protein